MLVFTIFCFLIPVMGQASQITSEYQSGSAEECDAILHELEVSDALFQQLTNPVITSEAQLKEAISWALNFQNCVTQVPDSDRSRRQELAEAYNLIFLIFTTGLDTPLEETSLETVELADVDDPAVRILREQIGIAPPPGYIFLRTYLSRQVMHPMLQSAFSDPNIAGVTILNRYVAILAESPDSWVDKALQNQALPTTRSHELVHAYIGSALATSENGNVNSLPKWFEEGLATYLTKGSKPHTVMTPNLSVTSTASTEYQQYEQVFKYMQHRLGKAALYQSIGRVITGGDISSLYSDLSIPNEDWLLANTREWQQEKAVRSTWISLAGIALLSGVLYLSLPEYQCSCGFSGRKKDFSGGFCGQCGRAVDNAFILRGSNKIAFLPSCQVCGKRFWPWQRDQLQIHRYHIKAWHASIIPEDHPHAQNVYRICLNCLGLSQQTYSEYLQSINDEIEKLRGETSLLFEHWLAGSPDLPPAAPHLFYGQSEVGVEDLVDAALAQEFGEWSQIDSEFEFDPPLSLPPHHFQNPNGYANVFRRITDGMSGSIFSVGNQHYWIIWSDHPFR